MLAKKNDVYNDLFKLFKEFDEKKTNANKPNKFLKEISDPFSSNRLNKKKIYNVHDMRDSVWRT